MIEGPLTTIRLAAAASIATLRNAIVSVALMPRRRRDESAGAFVQPGADTIDLMSSAGETTCVLRGGPTAAYMRTMPGFRRRYREEIPAPLISFRRELKVRLAPRDQDMKSSLGTWQLDIRMPVPGAEVRHKSMRTL
jgi:hypothetical protein